VLRRSCKVLAHETAHLFGLAHCIYFNCLMNGSNRLAESDRRPLHLCPVCLCKLDWSIGFDVVERYASLERVTREAGFTDEAVASARATPLIFGRQIDGVKPVPETPLLCLKQLRGDHLLDRLTRGTVFKQLGYSHR
jgi:Peptidase family M54